MEQQLPSGCLIGFATSSFNTAEDRNGNNSPYVNAGKKYFKIGISFVDFLGLVNGKIDKFTFNINSYSLLFTTSMNGIFRL